ncbi:MAG: hypothetical protein LBH43_07740 [Treponema sp.]|jgi:hypothetical protein|nr:hypothetical protein [Treponema sp.]
MLYIPPGLQNNYRATLALLRAFLSLPQSIEVAHVITAKPYKAMRKNYEKNLIIIAHSGHSRRF